ncbi:MAG: DEAD/DEAH box helicase, partial [Proteobacteria bacterium]|nr:DEAD/DEAH box helicase [Pseudomonadota bacterium]
GAETDLDMHGGSDDLAPAFDPWDDAAPRVLTLPPRLSPWRVSACVLRPSEAAVLLANIPTEVTGGLHAAGDLVVWSAVSRFTLSLMLRGRLVPSLLRDSRGDEGSSARATPRPGWGCALDADADARALEQLGAALAPAPPAAREHITRFVNTAADGLARHWLSRGVLSAGAETGAPTSPLQAFIDALRAGKPVVDAPAETLAPLAEAFDSWCRPLTEPVKPPDFRTGFRLEPPAGGEGAWTVHFFLECVNESEPHITAAEIWEGSPVRLERGPLNLDRPHAHLLADLGRALRVFPALARALTSATPVCCALSLDEAATFVRSTAWLLQECGFRVLLPTWAADPSAAPRLVLSAHAGDLPDGEARFGLQTLLAYEWRVALGSDEIDAREFERVVAQKIPLVRLRDAWALIEPEPAAALLSMWRQHDGVPLTLGEALRLASAGDDAHLDVTPVELMLDGELQALTDARKVTPIAQPGDLRAQLRPYQAQGFAWMADRMARGLGACLADDMGLGKTIQVITLLLHDRGNGPWLLICPTSLMGSWAREMARFAPTLRVALHHGRDRGVPDSEADVVVTTYGLAMRDDALLAQTWRGVALDEAQCIKNAESRQARAVRSLRSTLRLALTGTPVENRLTDLWAIMEFLNPGMMGTRDAFNRRFATPIERCGDEGRRHLLRKAVEPFLLRRVKTDPTVAPDLPEKIERKVACILTREQASLYEATVRERLGQIDASAGIARRGLVLATMMRLKQICNHPAHFLDDDSPLDHRSGKLTRLEEILGGVLEGGERALVFTQFREWAVRLGAHLRQRFGVDVACLHGETTREERDALVERFQRDDGPRVLVLSVKAGGVGLTLTRATHVFHYDRWWNPAVENQATDRAYRIGQRSVVHVHKLVCQGTLEESIDRLLDAKRDLAESVVGSGESWLTEMTTAELADLLVLNSNAVEEEE